MTDAPRPLCSVCGVPLKEKRTALTYRLWCPACSHLHVLYRAQPEDAQPELGVPPFVAEWVEKQAGRLDDPQE
jgi:uncharacterized Zn finger protein (UPF0148 family)